MADFGIPFGSEPGFRRPILIVQDDDFNRSKIGTVVVVPFSTNLNLEMAPGNVLMTKEITRLSKDSVVVVSQIYAIDRARLDVRISKLGSQHLGAVEDGIRMVLGMRRQLT